MVEKSKSELMNKVKEVAKKDKVYTCNHSNCKKKILSSNHETPKYCMDHIGFWGKF